MARVCLISCAVAGCYVIKKSSHAVAWELSDKQPIFDKLGFLDGLDDFDEGLLAIVEEHQ